MTQVYQVTQDQFNLIKVLKDLELPFYYVSGNSRSDIHRLSIGIPDDFEKPLLRYIGGDPTVKFEVKEKHYLLSRIDNVGDIVYFKFSNKGNPIWDSNKNNAFTAPLDTIREWQTPAWEIVEVDA